MTAKDLMAKHLNSKQRRLVLLILLSSFLFVQSAPVSADDEQQDPNTSGPKFRPGHRLIEKRRQWRQQRMQEKLQKDAASRTSNAAKTSIQSTRDHSIDIITGSESDRKDKSERADRPEFQGGSEKNDRAEVQEFDRSDRSEKSGRTDKTGEAPCLSWLNPLGKPRAIILCVHGLGLHSGSYEQFGKAMAPRGYAVYAVDVRGFGSWMAAKGREKCDFKHCSDDIVSTLKVLRMANPGVPVFLLGESMGGAIALDVASEHPELINGLISAVPAAERFKTGKTDVKVFMHLLTGNRNVNVEKSVINRATANPTLREEWTGDPLGRVSLSAKELMQFQVFMNDNHDRARKINQTPVLIVQGGKDKLVKADGTKELFEELVTADKKMAMVNGAEHLVYEEGQFSKEVVSLTDGWIKQHLPGSDGLAVCDELIKAREMMMSKQFMQAIPLLQQVIVDEPQNPEPFVLLGLAYLKTGHPLKARENVRKAFTIARESKDADKARKANDLLLNLPPEIVGPILSRNANLQAQRFSRVPPMEGVYKVLIFSAKWCEPCKDLNPIIEEAKSRFGKKVEFTVLDVEEESNQELVEKYHVSPIPTMIFLRPNGEVADYSVGFSGVSGMIKGIAKMLLPG